MKALILYRSFYGNTKAVAEVIARELAAVGYETLFQDVRQRLPPLEGFDCAVVGSPTRMARANRKALSVLKKLGKKGLAGQPVAVFDTYGPVPKDPAERDKAAKWITPGAAGILEEAARNQGLKVHGTTLRCEMAGLKGPLAEHEQEKAAVFAREFGQAVKDSRFATAHPCGRCSTTGSSRT